MNQRAVILSAIIITIAGLLVSCRIYAQAAGAQSPRVANYTCEINGAISLASDSKKPNGQTLVGRGVATCRSGQGFSTDYPIVMTLTADTSLRNFMTGPGIKAIADSFAVNHDPGDMFDRYQNYTMLHPGGPQDLPRALQSVGESTNSRSIILHGTKHKLFINLELVGNSDALQGLKIHDFNLEYDNEAPTLEN